LRFLLGFSAAAPDFILLKQREAPPCPSKKQKAKIANATMITEIEVAKIAQLAHLEITDEELKMFTPQIAQIVSYVEQLNELDTAQVAPMLGGLTPEGARTHATREDVIKPSLGTATALDQAPESAAGHFRVPKVL
jgi:aspartyl-tRNA(Asn)/glutamyl-tRNA(Gln) amidotransferase subunit C